MRWFILALLALFGTRPSAATDAPVVRVWTVHFSPDGTLLAAAIGDKDVAGRVAIWDTKTFELVREHAIKVPRVVRFAPDGKTLAVAAENQVHLFDMSSGKADGQLSHPQVVSAMAFGPSGKLATAANDGVIRIWDVKEPKSLLNTTVYREGCNRLAYSTDGKWLAGADRQQAYQWDGETGKEVRKFPDGGMPAFSADGALLLRCVGNEGTLVINDTTSGKFVSTTKLHGGQNYFDFAPACEVIAASSSFSDSDPIVSVQKLRFSPPNDAEQKQIDELLKKLDADDVEAREAAGQELLRWGWLVEPILTKAMAESSSAEVRLRARKLHIQLTNRAYAKIIAPEGRITALALSGDGKRIAVGGLNGAVHIVGVHDGKLIRTLRLSNP